MNCINLSADDIASLDKKDILSKQHYQNNENRILFTDKKRSSVQKSAVKQNVKAYEYVHARSNLNRTF